MTTIILMFKMKDHQPLGHLSLMVMNMPKVVKIAILTRHGKCKTNSDRKNES
jgi:hypothetical protein